MELLSLEFPSYKKNSWLFQQNNFFANLQVGLKQKFGKSQKLRIPSLLKNSVLKKMITDACEVADFKNNSECKYSLQNCVCCHLIHCYKEFPKQLQRKCMTLAEMHPLLE